MPKRPPIPPAVRREVIERSGHICEHPTCRWDAKEMDHIIPVALNGESTADNLQHLCKFHHYQKTHTRGGDRTKIRKVSSIAEKKPVIKQGEIPIQRAIFDYLDGLRLNGKKIRFWRTNATGPGRRKGFKANIGMPDIMGVIKGKFIAIEVKKPDGEPSLEQFEAEYQIAYAEGECYIVDNLDSVKQLIEAML